MLEPDLPPSSFTQRLMDLAAEMTGLYRLSFLSKRGTIAFSAIVKSPSRLIVGWNVTIQRGAILHCGGKAWSGFKGFIRIRDGVTIGPYCVIYGAGGIVVEECVHLGPGVKLMSQGGRHDHMRISRKPNYTLKPIQVGAGSWIGAGTVILGGSTIGRCVSVSPNSVVHGAIPDFAVAAGNPARIIFNNNLLT